MVVIVGMGEYRCFSRLIAVLLVGLMGAAGSARAEEKPQSGAGAPESKSADGASGDAVSSEHETQRWYFMVGGANAHPRLESEDLIRQYFDPIMNNLAPGHGDVLTVGDLRDVGLLWTPFVAMGFDVNDHWSVFVQVGFATGKVRTKETNTSIILLPLHTDFEIQRGALFGGLEVNYYPWGMARRDKFESIKQRLKASRPYLGASATYTNATYDAKVRVGFKPFPNIVSLDMSDAWGIPSYGPVLGMDIPLTKNSVLSVNASYNWFTEEEQDFNGPAYTVTWKHYFK